MTTPRKLADPRNEFHIAARWSVRCGDYLHAAWPLRVASREVWHRFDIRGLGMRVVLRRTYAKAR